MLFRNTNRKNINERERLLTLTDKSSIFIPATVIVIYLIVRAIQDGIFLTSTIYICEMERPNAFSPGTADCFCSF